MVVGTIHYIPSGKGGKAACGMSHPKMATTSDRSKSSCPQCLEMTPVRGRGKGQAK